MALPNVILELLNGQLGSLLSSFDGVSGQVIPGVSNGSIVSGTPFLVTSLEDAVTKGLADASNPFAYKYVKEFYDEAPVGTELYLMIVPDTMTVDMMADKTNANGAVKLLDFAEGRIVLLGVMDDPASITTANGFDQNVNTAKVNMQALAEAYAGTDKQTPFWGFVAGTGCTGVATDATDQKTSSDNYVSIVAGDTVSGGGCMLGNVMGLAASLPVQRKISRVENGKLNILSAYVGNTLVEKATTITMYHDKGYIVPRKFPLKDGYFWARDWTCTSDTDDYKFGARRRVINKIRRLIYLIAVEQIEGEIPLDEDNSGNIDAAYAKTLESTFENQINQIMVANGELVSFDCFIDVNQNVLSTDELNIVYEAVPVGYNGTIKGTIGFKNPALQ